MGDLVTRWRRSLVKASFDWSKDPASIIMLQAAQDHETALTTMALDKNAKYGWIATIWDHWLRASDGLRGGCDTLDLRGLQQLTLSEAWSQSNTQQMDTSHDDNKP